MLLKVQFWIKIYFRLISELVKTQGGSQPGSIKGIEIGQTMSNKTKNM